VAGELETARAQDVDVGGVDQQVEVVVQLEHCVLDDPQRVVQHAHEAVLALENPLELGRATQRCQPSAFRVGQASEVAKDVGWFGQRRGIDRELC
jgi:hypothetical protein